MSLQLFALTMSPRLGANSAGRFGERCLGCRNRYVLGATKRIAHIPMAISAQWANA